MEKITRDMGIIDAVQKYPQIVEVFFEFGMGCLGCAAAHFETIEQGAMAHGMDVDALMAALNKAADKAEEEAEAKAADEAATEAE
ncbi:MAG: DUF1858 domain-containing protein [Firmicutes bacterium]|nr:DUF1858 domain-containing protein [Bacillota bacterium]